MCADFVREGAKVCDVGTDHAYLPIWLCLSGKCPHAIAADINPDPLKRGQAAVERAGMERLVTVRLSDGLQSVESDEADDIVIAGMGGELIAKIIADCAFSQDEAKRFILQPMTKSETLIKYLCENGYEILRQDCCIAAKKCYTVLLVKYTGKRFEPSREFCYVGRLKPKENPTHKMFVEAHIQRLLKQAKGDEDCYDLAEKLKEKL